MRANCAQEAFISSDSERSVGPLTVGGSVPNTYMISALWKAPYWAMRVSGGTRVK